MVAGCSGLWALWVNVVVLVVWFSLFLVCWSIRFWM